MTVIVPCNHDPLEPGCGQCWNRAMAGMCKADIERDNLLSQLKHARSDSNRYKTLYEAARSILIERTFAFWPLFMDTEIGKQEAAKTVDTQIENRVSKSHTDGGLNEYK